MSKVLVKFKEIMGFEEEEYDEGMENMDEMPVDAPGGKGKKGKIVNIHNAMATKVLVIKPKAYDDAREIADAIKARKIVLVNTINFESKVAQRLVDFISGACYVLGGEVQEVEDRIYLLSPANTEVINDNKSEPLHKTIFNWNKEEEK